MTKVYAVNVGANSRHGSHARSPIFGDGTSIFVPFCHRGKRGVRGYSSECRPFIQNINVLETHDDPDWKHLTYGDDCDNPRAGALKQVVVGDILLFWGMLWDNIGDDWSGFTGEHGWYLFGAFRICEIADGGNSLSQVTATNRTRAAKNVHFHSGNLSKSHRVFIGAPKFSAWFHRPVDLEVDKPKGLIYRAFAAADGRPFSINTRPRWSSSLRSCRPIFDLDNKVEWHRAQIVRDAISSLDGFDILKGLLKPRNNG